MDYILQIILAIIIYNFLKKKGLNKGYNIASLIMAIVIVFVANSYRGQDIYNSDYNKVFGTHYSDTWLILSVLAGIVTFTVAALLAKGMGEKIADEDDDKPEFLYFISLPLIGGVILSGAVYLLFGLSAFPFCFIGPFGLITVIVITLIFIKCKDDEIDISNEEQDLNENKDNNELNK
ncbi:MAG: hypothetical protein ACRC28_12080 [Clostridium sp.]|uniref:hypothetical protein n=1 Tax=Clostridium sp. TaxID=1506 RepID=UPI003F3F21CE